MATPDLTPSITTAGGSPIRANQDGQVTELPSLSEQIKADQYLKAAAGAANGARPFRTNKFMRPNPGDVNCGRFRGGYWGGGWW